MEMLKVFIGWDERESIAFHTLVSSIIQYSRVPVSIIPLKTEHLKAYSRTPDDRQTNAFSYTRFLVPYLSNYDGWAVYMDCDMIVTSCLYTAITNSGFHDKFAVGVVQHDYTSAVQTKYLNQKQLNYPRKNWSSFVVWNCGHPSNARLDEVAVNTWLPSELHRFSWLVDNEIFALPKTFNFLVGEYEASEYKIEPPLVIHWTLGGPYFKEYSKSDFTGIWQLFKDKVNHCDQI